MDVMSQKYFMLNSYCVPESFAHGERPHVQKALCYQCVFNLTLELK